MNYAEQLRAERDLAIVKFADKFSETIKPILVESAKKGYSAYRYKINQLNESEKEKLHLYANSVFVDRLSQKLDGILVEYEKMYIENIIFKDRGRDEHFLHFSWRDCNEISID